MQGTLIRTRKRVALSDRGLWVPRLKHLYQAGREWELSVRVDRPLARAGA